MKFTVALQNGTIGTIDSSSISEQHASDFIGDVVTVHLHDENGNAIEETGVLAEVIDESEH